MNRHKMFAQWYTLVSPAPDPTLLDRRWAIVEALLNGTKAADEILDVVSIAISGELFPRRPEWLETRVNNADSSFPLGHTLELSLLCAAAVITGMENLPNQREWSTAALLVVTSESQSVRSRVMDLYSSAHARLISVSRAERSLGRVALQPLIHRNPFEDIEAVAANTQTLATGLKDRMANVEANFDHLQRSLADLNHHFARAAAVADEKTEVLWLILSERKRSGSNVPLIDKASRLAAAVRVFPPPENLREFADALVGESAPIGCSDLQRETLTFFDGELKINDSVLLPLTSEGSPSFSSQSMTASEAVAAVARELIARNELNSYVRV